MKLLIEIPDETFNRLRELAEMNVFSDNLFGYSLLAIAHGQVVPDSLQGWKYEERPKGKWHPISEDYKLIYEGNRHECNRCKEYAPSFKDGSEHLTNFCPNCGADMRKPNCVRCDHFGDCDGCEKGEEE